MEDGDRSEFEFEFDIGVWMNGWGEVNYNSIGSNGKLEARNRKKRGILRYGLCVISLWYIVES